MLPEHAAEYGLIDAECRQEDLRVFNRVFRRRRDVLDFFGTSSCERGSVHGVRE